MSHICKTLFIEFDLMNKIEVGETGAIRAGFFLFDVDSTKNYILPCVIHRWKGLFKYYNLSQLINENI